MYTKKTICHSAVDRRLGCIITTYCTISCLVTPSVLQIHIQIAEESFFLLTFSFLLAFAFYFHTDFPILPLITGLNDLLAPRMIFCLRIICDCSLIYISFLMRGFLSAKLPPIYLPLAPSLFPLSTLLRQHFDSRVAGGGGLMGGGGCRPR